MAEASHCPRCQGICPPGEECPNCLLGARLAPRFVPLPREKSPPTAAVALPMSEKKPAPLGLLAVLFGVLGFAMAWTPSLRPVALAVSGVGVLLGLVLLVPALSRGLSVSGLPLAGALVSCQGLIVAYALLPRVRPAELAREDLSPPAVAMIPGPPSATEADQHSPRPPMHDPVALAAVRQARELWKADGKPLAVVTACLPRLGHDDPIVREEAADLLGKVGAAAVPEIAPRLKADDLETRRGAARALAALGPKSKNELAALLKATTDSDAVVRLHAAKAVYAITLQDKVVVPVLKRCLEDDDPAVRRSASEALQAIEEGQRR